MSHRTKILLITVAALLFAPIAGISDLIWNFAPRFMRWVWFRNAVLKLARWMRREMIIAIIMDSVDNDYDPTKYVNRLNRINL